MHLPYARRLRQHWIGAVLLALLVYFGWWIVHGERGLIAWGDLGRTLEAKRYDLKRLEARRAELEAQVEGLRPEAIDPDILAGELYEQGYVGENEMIVLDPAPAKEE